MALLSDSNRKTLWSKIMSAWSSRRDTASLTKADLRAAVDAIDQWTEDNQASFNSAIPQPARAALTAKQKAEIFHFILKRRFEVT